MTTSLEFASQVMEFVRYHAMLTSVELSDQARTHSRPSRAAFTIQTLTWQPPAPLMEYATIGAARQWTGIRSPRGSRKHGIRNAAQTTIAPTGTIATVAGCEGYGCEPVFALAYIRHVNDNGKDLQLNYVSPQFEQALEAAGLDPEVRERIVER